MNPEEKQIIEDFLKGDKIIIRKLEIGNLLLFPKKLDFYHKNYVMATMHKHNALYAIFFGNNPDGEFYAVTRDKNSGRFYSRTFGDKPDKPIDNFIIMEGAERIKMIYELFKNNN